jgi:hypothetical protein
VEPFTYVIATMAWNLPENAIILFIEPIISDLLVTPTFFNPIGFTYTDIQNVTFTYTLSKTADVEAKIFDTDNFVVQTVTATNVPAGPGNTITWDGKNEEDFYVAPGIYRLKLVATDASGNRSLDANALLEIFY